MKESIKARVIFRKDGTLFINVGQRERYHFASVSAAVNFCAERNIDARFQQIKK